MISSPESDEYYSITEDGVEVAAVYDTSNRGYQEALHYFAQYSQDGGEVLVWKVRREPIFGEVKFEEDV